MTAYAALELFKWRTDDPVSNEPYYNNGIDAWPGATNWWKLANDIGFYAALALWGLFGTTNQLLAALTLSLATLYLKRREQPIWYTGLPAIFMMGSTLISMCINLWGFAQGEADLLLLSVGGALLFLGLWVLVALLAALRRAPLGWQPEIIGLAGEQAAEESEH